MDKQTMNVQILPTDTEKTITDAINEEKEGLQVDTVIIDKVARTASVTLTPKRGMTQDVSDTLRN